MLTLVAVGMGLAFGVALFAALVVIAASRAMRRREHWQALIRRDEELEALFGSRQDYVVRPPAYQPRKWMH